MKDKQDYYLNIHSRNITIKENESGDLEEDKSLTGHFYLSLQAGEVEKHFGKYPTSNVLVANAIVKTDKEKTIHDQVVEYIKQEETDHVHTKRIRLTEEQYERAREYAETYTGKYVIGISDCTDFVQSVYNAAGLPLYFTTAYSREELNQIGSLAANKVSTMYGNRDNISIHLSSVSGVSREKVAAELNLPIEKVIPLHPDIDLDLHPTALPKFRILIDASDLIPIDSEIEIAQTFDISLSANMEVNQLITRAVETSDHLSIGEKERLLRTVEKSNQDIESVRGAFQGIKVDINAQMEKCVSDYFAEREKPENKLAGFGFAKEEIKQNATKVANIMANYQAFNSFFQEINEQTDIKLALSDIPEDITRFESIILNSEEIIEFYECGLIRRIQDLPQDQKLLDKVFEYQMGIVFMKENSVISSLEDLYQKIPDIEDISSFPKMALKSIEILEACGETKKALSVKLQLLISTIPEEEQTSRPKILETVKNSGDMALLGYCEDAILQEATESDFTSG